LSAHLKKQFEADVTLIRGGGGAFEIEVDGRLIFSKLSEGRFPTHDEIDLLISGA
jgi:selT/selW/selH-like putative selenoprotein